MATKNQWHAGRILFALSRHFSWWQHRMLPEFEVDGGRADLVVITRSNYLTEIEIKVSLSDWNADQHKDKFKRPRPHVARFFYAIPETLQDRIPDWLPPTAGVLVVSNGGLGWDYVREVRAAKRLPAKKVDDQLVRKIEEACYYRFWRSHMQAEQRRLHDQRRPVPANDNDDLAAQLA